MDPRIMAIRRGDWKQIILAASNSGMTKKKWCEQNGISTKSFYHWQKVIRDAELQGLPIGLPENGSDSESALIEIRPGTEHHSFSHTDTSECADSAAISICAGQYRIDVRDCFSTDTLARILQVVSHA